MKKRICEDCRENDKALIPVLNMKTRKIIYRCYPCYKKREASAWRKFKVKKGNGND